jgi:hypothetical protein
MDSWLLPGWSMSFASRSLLSSLVGRPDGFLAGALSLASGGLGLRSVCEQDDFLFLRFRPAG